MLHDNYQHKREKIENCESCRYYFKTPYGDQGNCHRFPPVPPPNATSGHVTVSPIGWCGEYKADEHKIKELGSVHFEMRRRQAEIKAKDSNDRGAKLRATYPNSQRTIATNKLK